MKSHAWSYYEAIFKDDSKYGRCLLCEKLVKCPSGSTTGLAYHLSHHKEAYEEFLRKKAQGTKDLWEQMKVKRSKSHLEKLDDNLDLHCETEHAKDSNNLEDALVSDTRHLIENDYSGNNLTEKIEKIILQGNDFNADILTVFKELVNDEHFTNVTIVTDGGKMEKAHKVVLSAFSPFFKNILVTSNLEHPVIYLRGVDPKDMRAILDYIYMGQARIDTRHVNTFLKLAADLDIKGLRSDYGDEEDTDRSETAEEPSFHNAKSLKSNEELENEQICSEVVRELNFRYNSVKFEQDDSVCKDLKFYKCHECDYQAQTEEELIVHIEAKHISNLVFCNICDFYTKSGEGLTDHQAKKHSNQHNQCMSTG